MSVAAQFKAIGQSHHPLGLSAFKTRSGQGAGKTQRITQKIIHNYEQVILSLSNEQKKQSGLGCSPARDAARRELSRSPVQEFRAFGQEDCQTETKLKLVNSVKDSPVQQSLSEQLEKAT